jgi:hypothetical protein
MNNTVGNALKKCEERLANLKTYDETTDLVKVYQDQKEKKRLRREIVFLKDSKGTLSNHVRYSMYTSSETLGSLRYREKNLKEKEEAIESEENEESFEEILKTRSGIQTDVERKATDRIDMKNNNDFNKRLEKVEKGMKCIPGITKKENNKIAI